MNLNSQKRPIHEYFRFQGFTKMHFFPRLPGIIRYSLTFSDKKSQIGYPVKKLQHFIIDLEQFQFWRVEIPRRKKI